MSDSRLSARAAMAWHAELVKALRLFQRRELKGSAWPKDWLGPCFCDEPPRHWQEIVRGHDDRCKAARRALGLEA